tara:strand:- start:160 stop:1077 length:918 start_codon:yes stop_codon:yes gene_type:complete
MKLKDQLSWTEFYRVSSKEKKISEVKPFNRLIAHTKNLFIISGYGAFTKGYFLIVTKDFIPSFGLISNEMLKELNFLINLSKHYIKIKYSRNVAVFEHGMCACIGGLDRAHIHLMSVNKNSTEKSFRDSIDKVLYKRKVGIDYIKLGEYKLENIHDINQFMDSEKNKDNKDYEIVGRLSEIKDIKNLDVNKWPLITLSHIKKGGHYVYFGTDYPNSSFLTIKNFQTQFGRQVVFENELVKSSSFKKEVDKIIEKNPLAEVWKWQSCTFNDNIIETVNESRSELKNLKELKEKFKKEIKEFEFKVI